MQTLWSRAVQTKCTCQYSSCFSYGTALARRSTTATARRGLRFGDAFTAFYSSIFAIAAIADAKGKDARRKKWDEAIAGAKNDLEALERKQQSRVDASSADVATNKKAAATEKMRWQELFGRAAEEKRIRASLGLEGLKGIELDLLEILSPSEIEQLLPEVVCGDLETDLWRDWKSDRYFRHGFPTKKLKTFELSIYKLVLRFRLGSKGCRNATPEQPETSRATAQELLIRYREALAKRITNIDIRLSAVSNIYSWPSTSMDLESPNRPQYIKPFENEELNIALHTAILAWEEQKLDIDTLISRICYNLLVSSTPPDVHTYNMLIVVLCRLKQHGLVRAVLESMLECHVPPNTVTISAALRFYNVTKDRSGFKNYVKLVGSKDGVLDLSQPAISILSRRSDVLPRYLHKIRLVRTDDTTSLPVDLAPIREDAYMLVLQKAPRDQAVLEELFCGTIQFFGLSQARYCYKALVEEGWEVNVRILTLMLKKCARRRYWRFGRMVWQQLHDLGLQAGKRAYYWMLSLCHYCRKDREFQAIIKQASSQGVNPEIPVSWNLSSLKRQIEVSFRKIGNTTQRVGDIELCIYRGPSSGHMINHRLKMLRIQLLGGNAKTRLRSRRKLWRRVFFLCLSEGASLCRRRRIVIGNS